MQDYLVRAVNEEQGFKIFAVRTTNLVEEARKRHNTWPVATAALGRSLTAGLLLGANLKDEELITIRIIGDGPLGAVIVSVDDAGNVRGYVQNPQLHLPSTKPGKLAVGAAVGRGMLYVTRDMWLKEPFTGSCELVSGEIAEDIAQYLLTSEQTPSAVSLGVLVEEDNHTRAAGGLLVQLFPGAEREVLEKLEQNIGQLPPISSLIDAGKSPEEIVNMVANGLQVKFLKENPVYFACRCSREKLEEILISLGREEINQMIKEQQGVEVVCHFCGEKYHFTTDELEALKNRI